MPQPAPPVPVIPAGYGPLPADFTSWVTGPFGFLSSKVMFRAQLQGSQSLSGFTLAQLDTILEDPYGGWSATLTGSQAAWSWLCPAGCSGWYEVTMTATTTNPGSTTDQVQSSLFVDGVGYATGSGSWGASGHQTGNAGAVQVPLLGGTDYVQMYINSTASTTTTATAGRYPTMEIAWISA